jgi:hypothetical protein
LSNQPSDAGVKFIFFILLSLNVVVFLWGYFGYEHSDSNKDVALRQSHDPSIGRIILVGEGSEAKNPRLASTESGEPGGLPQFHDSDEPAIFPSVDQQLADSIEQVSERVIADLLKSRVVRQINEHQTTAADEFGIGSDRDRQSHTADLCCPEVKVRAGVKSFDGIVERQVEIREGIPPEVQNADSAGQAVSRGPDDSISAGRAGENLVSVAQSAKLCYKLGPRFSSGNFAPITQSFKTDGIAYSLEAETVDVETAFMVYYPAAESFEASKANVKMLLSKGVRDLWLINKGTMRGNISLGILKTRERAEILRKELEAKQIHPLIQAKSSKRTRYFLVFAWPHTALELQRKVLESGFETQELFSADSQNCAR